MVEKLVPLAKEQPFSFLSTRVGLLVCPELSRNLRGTYFELKLVPALTNDAVLCVLHVEGIMHRTGHRQDCVFPFTTA